MKTRLHNPWRAAAIVLACLSTIAIAAPPSGPPGSDLGTITAVGDNEVTVTSLEGKSRRIGLEDDWKILQVDFSSGRPKESPAAQSALTPGRRVRLFSEAKKLVIMPDSGGGLPPRQEGMAGLVSGSHGTAPHAMPLQLNPAPVPADSRFDKGRMETTARSPFGFKDAVMLRGRIDSWNDEFDSLLGDLGVAWIEPSAIWGFRWGMVQKAEAGDSYTAFDWSRYDSLVRRAQARNIHLSAKIHCVPPGESGSHGGRPAPPSLPRDMEGYRTFVRTLVERYDGDGIEDMPGLLSPIKQWKIEDEPIHPVFWSGTGEEFATLLTEAYKVIKQADPSAEVICGMVYSKQGPLKGRDADAFLQAFYRELAVRNGPQRPYDTLDYHWIVPRVLPIADQYKVLEDEMAVTEKAARAHGYEPGPWTCLEMAVPPGTELEQARWLLRYHVYALARGYRQIFWSGLQAAAGSGDDPGNRQARDLFVRNTLVAGDGGKKFAYWIYQRLAALIHRDPAGPVVVKILDNGGAFAFKLGSDRCAPAWILWNDAEKAKTIRIALPPDTTLARVTRCIPDAQATSASSPDQLFPAALLPVTNRVDVRLDPGHIAIVEPVSPATSPAAAGP